MRRFISVIAFAATLVVVLGAAGCSQRFERNAARTPPLPAAGSSPTQFKPLDASAEDLFGGSK
jgi:hypothetical protein